MRFTRSYPWRPALLGLALALSTACSPQAPAPRADDGDTAAGVVLSGTSSSFAAHAYFRWFNQLAVRQNIDSDLAVMGSGKSIRTFLTDTVDFAGTDSAPTPEDVRSSRRGLLAFPVTAGAIAVVYNQPGCNLQLTRAQLADIFLGRLSNFSELGCSPQPLTVLHRSDASGSTANFSATLAAFSPEWRQGPGVGLTLRWPVGKGVVGSEEMAKTLLSTPNSIGYVESAFVRQPLQAAAIENSQGRFVSPDSSTGLEALADLSLDEQLLGSSPDPAQGYPIVNLNWMLVPARGLAERLPAMRTSLQYILSQAGQDDAELLGYIPLPPSMRERALQQLNKLQP